METLIQKYNVSGPRYTSYPTVPFLKNNDLNQQEWNNSETPVYCLDLLNYRSVSNAIALQFEIEHQSPQVLVIKNGTCVYHATHQAIDAAIVQAALQN